MKLQQRQDQSEGRLRGIRLLRWFRIYSTHANIHSSRMLQFLLRVKNAAAEFLLDFLSPEEVRLGMYRSERRIPAQFWTLHRVTGVNLETRTTENWDSSCIRPQNKPGTETKRNAFVHLEKSEGSRSGFWLIFSR